MIYTNRVGTSFLIESLNIKDSLFRQQYYQTNVLPFSHNGPQSSSIDFKKISSIRAAIGEQLERSSIYINNKRFKDFFVNGIDMLTGDEVRVPTYRLLLNWAIPLFNELDLSDLYNDTCGAASHIDSFNTINTAFLECFERQCLLYNWFTQSPGKRLDISLLNDIPEVSRIIRMAKQHVEEVHLFDISLYDGIKVIITLAFGKETKGVGLCAGWNYKNAILGSLKELFQYITVDVKSIDEIDSDFDKDNVSNPLFYGLHFLK